MLKNKKDKTMDKTDFLEEELAASEQYKDNKAFFDFVKNSKEEVYNLIESRVEEAEDMLVAGIMVLFEYCTQYEDFYASLVIFTEVYARQCREDEDRQKAIEELWRGIITFAVVSDLYDIPEDDGRFSLLEQSLVLPLYKYLWEDFLKIKQDKESK